jgi:hypothetical protein
VFPVRYGLDLYILFRRNSVFKELRKRMSIGKGLEAKGAFSGMRICTGN